MSEGITRRPRIRPVSRETSGPFSKLRGAKCFAEIDRRMRMGWSTTDLARAIQDEYGELKEVSFGYLKKLIDQYRLSIPPAELSMASPNSTVSRNATRKVVDGINELEELEKLYRLQISRIDIDVKNEQKIQKLFKDTGREVFVAMKILNQSAQLKMDLGLTKRQLGTMEVNGQLAAEVGERYGKDAIGKVIADPDSRRKVLGLAERMLALVGKANIDAIETLGKAMETSTNDKEVIEVESKEVDHSSEEDPSSEDDGDE